MDVGALDEWDNIPYIFAQEIQDRPMTDTTEPMEGAPLIAPSTVDHPLFDAIVEGCRSVYDPEIPVNIYVFVRVFCPNARTFLAIHGLLQ